MPKTELTPEARRYGITTRARIQAVYMGFNPSAKSIRGALTWFAKEADYKDVHSVYRACTGRTRLDRRAEHVLTTLENVLRAQSRLPLYTGAGPVASSSSGI